MADDIAYFYTYGSVLVRDLAEICGTLQARVYPDKLLVRFTSVAEVGCFEERIARHAAKSVRNIKRLPDLPMPEDGQ